MKKLLFPILAMVFVAMLSSCNKEIELAGTTWTSSTMIPAESFAEDSTSYATRDYELVFKDSKSGKMTVTENDHHGGGTISTELMVINFTYTFSDHAGIITGTWTSPLFGDGPEACTFTFAVADDGSKLTMPMEGTQQVFHKKGSGK